MGWKLRIQFHNPVRIWENSGVKVFDELELALSNCAFESCKAFTMADILLKMNFVH